MTLGFPEAARAIASSLQAIALETGAAEATREHIARLVGTLSWLNGKVAVIGLEGAGKSTLVNAILGSDWSPTHPNEPATAVPILFRDAPAAASSWTVHAIDGRRRKLSARDALPLVAQFKTNDAEQARSGLILFLVQLAHWILALFGRRPIKAGEVHFAIADVAAGSLSGCWLLDVPGFEGAGREFSLASLPVGMIEGAFTILMCRNRAYGGVTRLLGSFAANRTEPGAIVVNINSSDIIEDSDIGAIRQAFLTSCESQGLSVRAADVFVLSAKGLRQGDDSLHPALDAEHDRFSERVQGVIAASAGRAGRDVIARLSDSIGKLAGEVEFKADRLRAIRASGAPLMAQLPFLAAAVEGCDYDVGLDKPGFEKLAKRLGTTALDRLRRLRASVRSQRAKIVSQGLVFASHMDGVRSAIDSAESAALGDLQGIFDALAQQRARDAITGFAAALELTPDDWPVTRDDIARYLAASVSAPDWCFSPPSLPSASADFGVLSAIFARKAILESIDSYARLAESDHYFPMLEAALYSGVARFSERLRAAILDAMGSWTASDPILSARLDAESARLGDVARKLAAARAATDALR